MSQSSIVSFSSPNGKNFTIRMAREAFINKLHDEYDISPRAIENAIAKITPYIPVKQHEDTDGIERPSWIVPENYDIPMADIFPGSTANAFLLFEMKSILDISPKHLTERVKTQDAELDSLRMQQNSMIQMIKDLEDKLEKDMDRSKSTEQALMRAEARSVIAEKLMKTVMARSKKAEALMDITAADSEAGRKRLILVEANMERDRKRLQVLEAGLQSVEVDREADTNHLRLAEKDREADMERLLLMEANMVELKKDLADQRARAEDAQLALERTLAAQAENISDTDEYLTNGDASAYNRIKLRHLLNLTQAKLAHHIGLVPTPEDTWQAPYKWRKYCTALQNEKAPNKLNTRVMAMAVEKVIRGKCNTENQLSTEALIASGALALLVDDSKIRRMSNYDAHPGPLKEVNADRYRIAVKSHAEDDQVLATHLTACLVFLLPPVNFSL